MTQCVPPPRLERVGIVPASECGAGACRSSWSAGAPASAQRPPVSPSSGRRAVGVWRVAMVEEDAVAGWVADSDAVAAAGVPHLAELEAGGFELRLRRRDIGDAQRDRCGRQ